MTLTAILRRILALVGVTCAFAALPGGAADATAYRPPAFADPDRAQRVRALAAEIDSLYRTHAASTHIPGLAYGVVVDGGLVVSGACGFADVARKVLATTNTVFRIASMTKSFTALSVLRLRDEGRLDLDRPVRRYLPELWRLPLLTTDSPPITARHLLTHGAGFPEDNPWGDRQLADTEADLVELVRSPARFANAPGVAYEYSNLGFALLGRLVHRVSGQSCQAYISRQVLRPLGMTSTYWDYTQVPADRLAHGYRWRDGAWVEEPLLQDGSYAPMGGLMSTVSDFAKYLALHLAATPPRDDPETGPLRRASLREMQHPWRFSDLDARATDGDGAPCPTASAYGYGLRWAQDCRGRVRVGHTGGLPGFGSQWRVLPEYGLGVVVFGNVTYAQFSAINTHVVDSIIDRAGLKPRHLPPSAILQKRARELRAFLPDWTGAETSGIFAENFFPDNPIESLRTHSRDLFGEAGEIQAVGEVQPENQLRGSFILRGAQTALEVFFTLTPENPPRIQEFHLREVPAAVPSH